MIFDMTNSRLLQHWAIFCRVVDNHGDLGVCWRLASQLANKGKQVTLYVDDASALAWMAPVGCEGVKVLAWPDDKESLAQYAPADVVIEAFGCELPLHVQAAMASQTKPPVWINLEYFSTEAVSVRNHGLPSPIMSGPAKGMTKWFFYPGLDVHSGGLLRGIPLSTTNHASQPTSHNSLQPLRISVFCYEPASLPSWLVQLCTSAQTVSLLVAHGRATQAVQQAWQQCLTLGVESQQLSISYVPALSQDGYDAMLAGCDLNLVRGEDSLVRAIWAGKALLWQIYPQDDGAHISKLQAFLEATHAPPVVVQAHWAWNAKTPTALPEINSANLQEWTAWAKALQQSLQAQTDLLTRLESFVAAHG